MANQIYDADVRYGSSFLSVSKNKQSVPGEIMTDKTTGEIYIKRPQDSKIISFRQKSHTMYEAIQEFNMQFQSSIGFTYPEDPGSYLLGTKIDVDEYVQDENKIDLLIENHEFSTIIGDKKDFRFDVSNKTNGFYIKPITRLGDRNINGYLTGQFSEHEYVDFATVTRSFTDWLDLSNLYSYAYLYTEWKEFENWKSSNAFVDCTITTIGSDIDGNTIKNVKEVTVPIQLDEHNYVGFPSDYNEEMETIYSINVVVNKIYAPKLQYERYLANDSNTTSGINPIVDRMIEIDNKVVLQSVDLFYFISGSSQLPTNDNTLITQCFDVEFLDQAIIHISTSSGARAVQSQEEKPDAWPIDTVWSEEIRDIVYGERATETSSITKFSDLERSLYHDPSDIIVFTDEFSDAENILITHMKL